MDLFSRLLSLSEPAYGDFSYKLAPNLRREDFLGIRVPKLRALAKEIRGAEREAFLDTLPHRCYEENLLHAILLCGEGDYRRCLDRVSAFLPFVDNWAACDTLVPRCFARHREELLPVIREWIASGKEFTVRFGVDMLMHFYLGEGYSPEVLSLAASACSDQYYVNMMVAWFFATALIDHYEEVLPYLRADSALSEWVRRKAITKANESFRIPDEKKLFLKSLR